MDRRADSDVIVVGTDHDDLCSDACHPGPGVLPGYGGAHEVAAALGDLGRSPARTAA